MEYTNDINDNPSEESFYNDGVNLLNTIKKKFMQLQNIPESENNKILVNYPDSPKCFEEVTASDEPSFVVPRFPVYFLSGEDIAIEYGFLEVSFQESIIVNRFEQVSAKDKQTGKIIKKSVSTIQYENNISKIVAFAKLYYLIRSLYRYEKTSEEYRQKLSAYQEQIIDFKRFILEIEKPLQNIVQKEENLARKTEETTDFPKVFLNREKIEEIITQYGDSFYIVCINNSFLRSNECAGYFATSEENAKKFYDFIEKDLPENMRNFSAEKIQMVKNIRDFECFFSSNAFQFIQLVEFGLLKKEELLNRNKTDVEFISHVLEQLNDEEELYSLYDEKGNAYSIEKPFKQEIFSAFQKAKECIITNKLDPSLVAIKKINLENLRMNPMMDLLPCSFDGYRCYGIDINEALKQAYQTKNLTVTKIQELIQGKKLFVVGTVEKDGMFIANGSGPIICTSVGSVKNLLRKRLSYITHEYRGFCVKTVPAFSKLIGSSKMVSIDEKYHCKKEDFLKAISEN